MCSRFYTDENIFNVLMKLRSESDVELSELFEKTDFFPSEKAYVISKDSEGKKVKHIRWGFKNKGSGLIINIRSETVLEKRIFSESVKSRRCLIPAAGFYEWNSKKEKNRFFKSNREPMFMAGIFDLEKDGERFAVLTTNANKSVADIHNRMPLILEKDMAEKWLNDGEEYKKILKEVPEVLSRDSEFEQIKLF